MTAPIPCIIDEDGLIVRSCWPAQGNAVAIPAAQWENVKGLIENLTALLAKNEADMRALDLWDHDLKYCPAGGVQTLIERGQVSLAALRALVEAP